MPKVTVIVPIYNVEHYIERCAISLLNQSLTDMEFIFVNDSTPDNSMSVLQSVIVRYPERSEQIKVINHVCNKGLASARLSGLKNATGDYIIHCDSDDWVELDMYEKMYNVAEQEGSDIVVCDLMHEFNNHNNIEQLNPKIPPRDVINKLNIRYGWYLVNKLVKRDLIFENELFPIPGLNMWEDVLLANRIYYYAKNVKYIEEPLYHYNRTNENSIISATSLLKKREQQYNVIEFLNDFFRKNNFDFSDAYLAYRIAIKDKFLEFTPTDYKSWRSFYPEIANYVLKDKSYSYPYRILYFLAQKGFVLPFEILRKISRLHHA